MPTTTSTTPAGVSACRTSQLTVALGPGGGAAGHTVFPIVFTNNGSGVCTITGYPGVSFTNGPAGDPIGAAATRDPGESATVRLDPGAQASASVSVVTSVDVYPPEICGPTSAAGLRIYPPDNTESVFLEQSRTVCSKIGILRVQPVIPGSGR
ncbi:DUF4232 domain-containing protein [Nocardia huaxiensis]|uniref:DUF4232 domain-containing protein n=1 Tax=Nocardia huaxiensis TaxID=2755382 RepID=A0A7D6ZHJ3_9NOCA|nr:DUF4232 domain-containing protein [Nocardia huaxiensis]QLY29880.1 DUF4232 domain-containing protein [Nocardia huaxiensis]UFS96532.1 DUF4232 domain-containing protein [Nocardia huaxiensis]